MSPVPLAVNPRAKGIGSVDNKFLNSSGEVLPMMPVTNWANDITEDYSQHYSSIDNDTKL